MNQYVSAAEAAKLIQSGDRVYIHSVAAAPQALIEAMVARAPELRDVEIVHLHTEGVAPYAQEMYQSSFRLHSLFVGPNVREATQQGLADYIPIFLSEVPNLFKRNILPLDVALVQVSPPDKHGFCSLGPSVEATKSAIENAKIVIAQVNARMPFVYGDGLMHLKNFDFLVAHDAPLPEPHQRECSEQAQLIGQHIAGLVEDGATLQMGIGAIPDAVLASLGNHKGLGVHTEMFSDGLIPLIQKGVVTNEHKVIMPGRTVSAFVMGSQRVYDFIDRNPGVQLMDVSFTNDVSIIRQNPKVTAINCAIEIDLTGQVCADSIGTRHYSGVGGQIDFIRGASYSEGGKPIIAIPSTTKRGESKINPFLKQGAGVVSTRANVHYIVTEWGWTNLYGKSLKQRAKALIDIAHPMHRDSLEQAAYERFGRKEWVLG
ncbi:acetyl-CoA hydrolase/transferase family protein [Cesiribacter andamanensis]|uniref:Propionyl-CoA:succinate CoA transferase n=1 Tax=Cesiribacter andamanensis AMV16 TaxID=1279009 RepID=M7N1S6_9BACT|nr:acetyl-CoA hydrolase/transferase C-terminal domain-containing protein [Cesiribacter andamanensis]EMR02638.1 Propionyl-CoA:succinate CoA transferase [Cesiribacter andamanensis AMV16]